MREVQNEMARRRIHFGGPFIAPPDYLARAQDFGTNFAGFLTKAQQQDSPQNK
jgi:hypothetical protein